jgi:hypothetical protein
MTVTGTGFTEATPLVLGWETLVGRSGAELLVAGFVNAALVLVLGGLLVFARRTETRRITDRALRKPIEAFSLGVGLLIGAFVLALFGALFGPGMVALVLLLFVAFWMPAAVFGYLAVGRYLTEGWTGGLVVASLIAALVAVIPVVGPAVSLAVGCLGVGVLVLEYREEYDGEFERMLAGPGTIRSRVGVATEDDRLRRFDVDLEYWDGAEWNDVVAYHHDSEDGDRDVTERGLHANVHGERGSVDVEAVADSLPAVEALGRAFEHLEANVERFVREYETHARIDAETATNEYEAPLDDDDLRAARTELAEQRRAVREYLDNVGVADV